MYVSQVLMRFRTHARRYRPNRKTPVVLVRMQVAKPVTTEQPKLPQLNTLLVTSRTLLRPTLHFTVAVHKSPAHLDYSQAVTYCHSPAAQTHLDCFVSAATQIPSSPMLSHMLCPALRRSAARRHSDFRNAIASSPDAKTEALETAPICIASYTVQQHVPLRRIHFLRVLSKPLNLLTS